MNISRRIWAAVAIVAGLWLVSAGPLFAAGADDILGVWATEGGKSRVEITRSGDTYSGHIIYLKEPHYPADDPKGMAGQTKVDRENPDAGLRSRPILGLRLMHGFHYAGDGYWTDGRIYDPESGKTYKCKMWFTKDGALKVRGYIGFALFGRTTVWTRYRAVDPAIESKVTAPKTPGSGGQGSTGV